MIAVISGVRTSDNLVTGVHERLLLVVKRKAGVQPSPFCCLARMNIAWSWSFRPMFWYLRCLEYRDIWLFALYVLDRVIRLLTRGKNYQGHRVLALVPGAHPAFRRLQYDKRSESLGDLITRHRGTVSYQQLSERM